MTSSNSDRPPLPLDSTRRFSNRVEDYRRYRPGYPSGVVELIRKICGARGDVSVADVGSGTGIFTRLLLEAGLAVTAVEPNGPMRAVAEEDLLSFPRFHSIAAPAERTGLPGAAFDAITVAQAFHWFEPVAARREFRRLLQPGGWVFLIWNDRRVEKSPLARAYEELLKSLGEAYESVRRRNEEAEAGNMREFFRPGAVRSAEFDNPQVMDWPGLRGRFLSASYVPAPGEARHEELLSGLEQIFRAHEKEGRVCFDQVTRVFYGQLDDGGAVSPASVA